MTTDAQRLKEHFELLASDQMSKGKQFRVNLNIGPKSPMYKYTIKRCSQFLEWADNDLELAKEVFVVLFTAKEFSWKTRTNIGSLIGDWDAGLAIVLQKRQLEKDQEQRQQPFSAQAETEWKELHG